MTFEKGDRVVIVQGAWAGAAGVMKRIARCSIFAPDDMIIFDGDDGCQYQVSVSYMAHENCD